MFSLIRQFLSPPTFEDEEQTRIAGSLYVFALAMFAACTLALIISLLLDYKLAAGVISMLKHWVKIGILAE